MSATLFMIEYFQNRKSDSFSSVPDSLNQSSTSMHAGRTSKKDHRPFCSFPKMHKRKPQTPSTPPTIQDIKGILKDGRDSSETVTESDELSFKAEL
jgi:hypothetical protein